MKFKDIKSNKYEVNYVHMTRMSNCGKIEIKRYRKLLQSKSKVKIKAMNNEILSLIYIISIKYIYIFNFFFYGLSSINFQNFIMLLDIIL